jgi:hypothetical protein
MKTQQSGNTFVLIIILVALLGVGAMMFSKQTPVTVQETPGIMNTSDLDAASKELDSVNVDSVDTGLNEIQKDSSQI